MKKSNLLLNLLLAIIFIGGFTACKEDDPGLEEKEGIQVSNGLYITQAGIDPVATSKLVPEEVEDDGFASQTREGFVTGYVYLTAGDYTIVNVTDKAITNTYGGPAQSLTSEDGNCEILNYTLIGRQEDGPAISISSEGLYKVTHDNETGEILILNVSKIGIIGAATSIGWDGGSTIDLAASNLTAEGGSWSATDLTLREGEFKVRLNCNWVIDRRIDPANGFTFDNGYQMFTNWGGTATSLVTGGANIPVSAVGGAAPDEAVYTITVSWTPDGGFGLAMERTGEASVISFDPADYAWGIIGDATFDEWNSDKKLTHKKDGDVHKWFGVFPMSADSKQFKFRTDDSWSKKLTPGSEGLATGTITVNATNVSDNGDTEADGSWFVDTDPGFFYVIISTADAGETWDITIDNGSWGVIGSSVPPNDWSVDVDLVYDANLISATASVNLTDGVIKFRANDDWAYNLGGNLAELTFEGADIAHTGTGTYSIVISTADGGVNWTATVQ